MDALLAAHVTPNRARSESAKLLRLAAFGLVALGWLVAVVLSVSRAAGGLSAAPEAASLWLLAVLFVLLAAGARQLWRAAWHENARAAEKVAVDWAVLPAMVLAGCVVAIPHGTLLGILGFAAIVVLAETWALRSYAQSFRTAFRKLTRRELACPAAFPPSVFPPTVLRNSGPALETNDTGSSGDQIRIDPPQVPLPHFPTEDIAQQLIRRVDADGNDIIQGWVRAAFEPRQRTAAAHVAFCPTLEGELLVEFSQVAGREARVKAAQLLPYGIRFDVKLADAAENAESVLIEFTVTGSVVACSS